MPWRAVAFVALCAWCGWTSGLHQSTIPAFATWSASLVGVVVTDVLLLRGSRHGRHPFYLPAERPFPLAGPAGQRRGVVGVSPWLALALVVLGWELLGIDTGPHQLHLTISSLARAYRPLDAAMLLLWMLAGLGYGVARARASAVGPPVKPNHRSSGPASANGVIVMPFGPLAFGPALLLPPNRSVGVAFWIGVLVVGGLVELAARHSRGRQANFEELLRLMSRTTPARTILVAAWAYGGWHLFAH